MDKRLVVFNAAAGLVGVAAVAFAVRSMLPSPTPPCSDRYHTAMNFALEQDGALLTPSVLQGRLGGRDVGLTHNVAIARLDKGPVPVAMAVDLRPGAPGSSTTEGGLRFPWEPRALQGKEAVCLSYQVMLPSDFEAGAGGALPGIRGVDRTDEARDAFLVRPAWRRDAKGGADQVVGAEQRARSLESEGFSLPRGRWVRLEQEVVLNAPGRRNGVYRTWADGALVVDRTDLDLRPAPGGAVSVAGVAASVLYGNEAAPARIPRDTRIWLSPFEIRWR